MTICGDDGGLLQARLFIDFSSRFPSLTGRGSCFSNLHSRLLLFKEKKKESSSKVVPIQSHHVAIQTKTCFKTFNNTKSIDVLNR